MAQAATALYLGLFGSAAYQFRHSASIFDAYTLCALRRTTTDWHYPQQRRTGIPICSVIPYLMFLYLAEPLACSDSEQMNLIKLIMPAEVAHDTVAELGELGNVQFKNVRLTCILTSGVFTQSLIAKPACQSLPTLIYGRNSPYRREGSSCSVVPCSIQSALCTTLLFSSPFVLAPLKQSMNWTSSDER